MLINVKVFPKSKKGGMTKKGDTINIHLSSAPEKGRANAELIKILADKYKISKSRVEIIKGLKTRNKIIKINI